MADEAEKPVNEKILLVEYEKAQDSAEHHDRLLWVAVGLIVTGMAALLRIPPGNGQPDEFLWTHFYPPVLGILLSVLLMFFVHSFASFRRQKYKRCKAIEGLLGMEQHSKLEDPKLRQVCVVYFLSGVFLLVWIWRLCVELHRGCT
jgi:hypothetical protein